jgi:D-alanyl-lipoteichoic acid acyltransferase DltB (MBOAT superfamily)
MKFIVIGMIYKGVFADQLGPLVDEIFKSPGKYNNVTLISAALGFYSQIYFDFVGYSTMAIGVSRLFGFRLPKNFDFPYRSTSITEFWRRWHISLSSWLRDYLYIPWGGNRHGTGKQYRNLILTMLLGGLWHGASYNFILWGGLHGLALALHKLFVTRLPAPETGPVAAFRSALGWAITQVFVLLAWIPFRANTFHDTAVMLQAIALRRPDAHLKGAVLPITLLVLPIVADHVLTYNRRLSALRWPARPVLITALLGLCLGLVFPLLQIKVQNFIYFQF